LVRFDIPASKSHRLEVIDVNFPQYQESSWKGGVTFNFINSTATLNMKTWEAPHQTELWHYNLHYFDDLNSSNHTHTEEDHSKLILQWWQLHEQRQSIAWDPYPSSLRAVNFCKWYWSNKGKSNLIIKDDLWSHILDRHYQEIKRKLELHIQANHLFANLKALWFLQAALPDYRNEESKWLCSLISKELDIQFDDTFGHFELSPMYHRIMLWDLLDMIMIGRRISELYETTLKIEAIVTGSFTWAVALSHPDEEVAFFNDSSMGIAPSLKKLKDYMHLLGFKAKDPVNSNYSGYMVESKKNAKLICDTAAIGPNFQPGHAHADTLSFELSIGKQRVIVNSGTSEYGVGRERLRQRSTSAHSTVTLDNKNSSDVWSGFRVGKKAKIVKHSVDYSDSVTSILSAHDGFSPSIHYRKWDFSDGFLNVTDKISDKGSKRTYIHFHPQVQVKHSREQDNCILLTWSDGKARLQFDLEVNFAIQDNTWHPEFGKSVPSKLLILFWEGEKCTFNIQWSFDQ